MARQRTLHPEFWTSPSVGRLSIPARLLWAGMWSNADDEGRLKGDVEYLKAVIFPHDRMPIQRIADWLAEVQAEDMVRPYKVEGQVYLLVPKFKAWQHPKYPSQSKLPAPPDGLCSPSPPPGLPQVSPRAGGGLPQPSPRSPLQDKEGRGEGRKDKDKEGRDTPSGAPVGAVLRQRRKLRERFFGLKSRGHQVGALVDLARLEGINLNGGRAAAIVREYGHGQGVIDALMKAIADDAKEPADYMHRILENERLREARRAGISKGQGSAAADPGERWAERERRG